MDGKVIKVVIDHREYLFKLSSEEEVSRLQQLAAQLEHRIQANKRSIVTNDYSKILILTCLDLLEEINQSQSKPQTNSNLDEEIFKKLIEIHSSLKQQEK